MRFSHSRSWSWSSRWYCRSDSSATRSTRRRWSTLPTDPSSGRRSSSESTLGSLTAALTLVLPATLLPLATAVAAGGTPYPIAVPLTLAVATILAAVAYGAFFLFLGLASRSALLIGLLFGFLWEELLPLLPGDVPRFTVIFYLRGFLSWELSSGPLSGFSKVVPLTGSLAVLLGLGLAFVLVGGVVLRYLETAPERESG